MNRLNVLKKIAINNRLVKLSQLNSSFRDTFAKLSGQAREDFVYNYVTSGKVPKPKLVPMKIKDPKTNLELTYNVMPDYFNIEGLTIHVTPITAEKIGRYFGLSLPTGKTVDLINQQADIKIPGKPSMDLLGGKSEQSIAYSDMMNKEKQKYKSNNPNAIIAGYQKDLIQSEGGNNLNATGMLDANGKPIQTFRQTAHDTSYVDYSHGMRLGEYEILDPDNPGKTIKLTFDELIRNPKYKNYAALVTDKPLTNYKSYSAPKQVQAPQTQITQQPATNSDELLNKLLKQI